MDLFVAFSKWEFDVLKISDSRVESFSLDILNIALWKLLFSVQNSHNFSIQMLNYTLAFWISFDVKDEFSEFLLPNGL